MRLQLHKRHLKVYFNPPQKVVLFNIFVEFVIHFFKIFYRIELNAPLLNKIINLFFKNLPGSVHYLFISIILPIFK